MRVAAYAEGHELNLAGLGEPIRLTGTRVSAELLSVLGARPALGRTFQPGEDMAGRDNYVILSAAVWEQRFARDPASRRPFDHPRRHEPRGHRRHAGGLPVPFREDADLDSAPRGSADAGDVLGGRLHARRRAAACRASRSNRHARTCGGFRRMCPRSFPWAMPASWNANVSVVPLQSGMVADVRARLLMLLGVVGAGAVHRVRERRQPDARARRVTDEGNQRSTRARRRTTAHRPAIADRERRPCLSRAACSGWRSPCRGWSR